MSKKCCVPHCKTAYSKDVSLFGIPVEESRRNEWIAKIEGLDVSDKNARVCSLHFADCYFKNFQRNRIEKNAIPTLFLKDMSQRAKNCYIQPSDDNYKSVILPHDEIVYIGRNHETSIADTFTSRKQLALKANYDKRVVECVRQGTNVSCCNGFVLKKDVVYTFKHSDKLELVAGKHTYNIIFEPLKSDEENPNKKYKLDVKIPILEPNTLPKTIKGSWQFIEESLLIYTPDIDLRESHIASFDLDGTIIKTKSGLRFPKDKNDWTLLFSNTHNKLKDLYLQGYRVVIFSNQLKLGREKRLIPAFKEKIENIVHTLGIPVQVFLATQEDIFRKPALGMWDILLNFVNEKVYMDGSFYVGDAAGREKNWAPGKSKDHSISDRLFALNIGIKFYTPEEYFLSSKPVFYIMPEFDPRTVTSYVEKIPLLPTQEAIIMVGSQGSGKSLFCKSYIVPHGYVYINRDTLGSKQKCLNLVEECLKMEKSIVIDNTNPTVDSRKPYLDLCKKYNIPCKCFHMNVPYKQCKHNNKFRSFTDKTHIPVSDIIINSFRKNFQEPTLNEGFSEIHEFKFNAAFKNKDDEKLYKMFLLESF